MWCLDLADLFSVIPVLPDGADRKEVAAPRRRLLTTVDSVLVPLKPVSSRAWLTMVSRYPPAPGSSAAQPAGAAGLLLGLSLRAGPRAHLLVHRGRAV